MADIQLIVLNNCHIIPASTAFTALDCINIAYGKTLGSTPAVYIWGNNCLDIRNNVWLCLISDTERLPEGASNGTKGAFD